MKTRFYGRVEELIEVPNLVELQTRCYRDFLQKEVLPHERENKGLEAIIREVFPIQSYNKNVTLVYHGYELSRPRYTPDECRKLKLTYGAPFKIRVEMIRGGESQMEDVYLGEVPIMIGGGEFIINGAERVIVSQLHRSPGVDFSEDETVSDKKLHYCWIIPERGSWIEIIVSKRDLLSVRIDQSGKLSATCMLRAIDPRYSTDEDIIRLFHETEKVKITSEKSLKKIIKKHVVSTIYRPGGEEGEKIIESGEQISERIARTFLTDQVEEVEIIRNLNDHLILNSLQEDPTDNHESALLKIYSRLRPGNPPQLAKAQDLFREKFFEPARYRLGKVGRFRLNRKFKQEVSESEMTLTSEDFINAIRYLLRLRAGDSTAVLDDIDHLGNRRVRTIDALAGDEFRKGFLKLKRNIQERLSLDAQQESQCPRSIINSKTISSAIDYFFGRGELSQVVDQTNPLSQLTHERRLSALGPGGLNRKRAGFEVRDVHVSHYGRICPIETPEGTNIGLIASLAIYAKVDEYGFLTTPYRVVRQSRLTGEIKYLRADDEYASVLVPADTPMQDGKFHQEKVLARQQGEFVQMLPSDIQFVDIATKQLVGVSASLIPFLEHDDANRALMGSNMQRQAVPLLRTQLPIVSTGMEKEVAKNSGMVVVAEESGTVRYSSATEIHVDEKVYRLRKFTGLNERTCLNQKPIVREGDVVKKGQVIADGAATHQGELALGKNILVAFMTWDGYNFEDAILVNENLVKNDVYTSIHIDEFEIEIRETKLGREEFTREIPNVSERALKNLDEEGIVRIGTKVGPGDILVGKVAPKSKSELSPEEKLLHAIFGRAGEDVKNDSLEVPSGVEGVVIEAKKFTRKVNLSEEQRSQNRIEIKAAEQNFEKLFYRLMGKLVSRLEEVLEGEVLEKETGQRLQLTIDPESKDLVLQLREFKDRFTLTNLEYPRKQKEAVAKILKDYQDKVEEIEEDKNRTVNRLTRGAELPSGVLEMVKVYVATKRALSVGDKVAGRHGNKGIISKILPQEDMPFLENGTPVEMLLNPLGVPSRMNVGQILETHLGWAASQLGFRAITPVFDGCKEHEIEQTFKEAGLPTDGKSVLYDGRTGESFDQRVTVGYIYMLKLHHLVDDKVHARATGPYSLITQQPLGGKARFGGQRFGEMEVWALEAYGAAYILQELLTVKSDDVDGRTKIYESMVKGENSLFAGTPVSFDVLTSEIKGLGLDMRLVKKMS
jgi:DNA-directed RNA polymerase subunit beta